MASFSYYTIKAPSQGVYKEKGSKFMAFAYPVTMDEEIKGHLRSLRKEYFDALHHGYVFVVGPGGDTHQAFDGEPNHSAGDPNASRNNSSASGGVFREIEIAYGAGNQGGLDERLIFCRLGF